MGFHEGAYATVWEITNQGDNFSKGSPLHQ